MRLFTPQFTYFTLELVTAIAVWYAVVWVVLVGDASDCAYVIHLAVYPGLYGL